MPSRASLGLNCAMAEGLPLGDKKNATRSDICIRTQTRTYSGRQAKLAADSDEENATRMLVDTVNLKDIIDRHLEVYAVAFNTTKALH